MPTQTLYQFQKQVNTPKLMVEIQTASLAVAIDHIDSTEDDTGTWNTFIWFVDVLNSSDQTTLSTIVSNHVNSPTMSDVLRFKIQAARNFGMSIIDEVAADNLMAGLTTTQVATMIQNYGGVMAMLQTGSLYTALAAMEAAIPDTVMTQARIDKYVGQIKSYLGIQ